MLARGRVWFTAYASRRPLHSATSTSWGSLVRAQYRLIERPCTAAYVVAAGAQLGLFGVTRPGGAPLYCGRPQAVLSGGGSIDRARRAPSSKRRRARSQRVRRFSESDLFGSIWG